MMNLNNIILGIVVITTVISIIFILLDVKKKREIKAYPFISFMMPTHNDSEYIEESIKSIYDSYNPDKFEIIVINDKSTDNTLKILAKLKNKYDFKLINNKVNKGKAISLNDSVKEAKGSIVLMLDSDTLLNKDALNDIVERFGSNPKVGGVSCSYKVRNRKGFLPRLQDVEYSMLSFIQASYNMFSAISLWGGCMAFRKKAFMDIGKLSKNFLTEDMDAALKLKEHGWKAEQSYYPVYTYVPTDLKTWYRQKLRWGAGAIQCLIKHYKIYLENPLVVLFLVSSALLAINFIIGLSVDVYTATLVQNFLSVLFYPLFALPYMLYDGENRKHPLRLLWAIPYSFLYYPVFVIICAIGGIKVVIRYKALERGERAW
jgi:biofilm PGA synthesis N-glycosyltransferase PgaC